uniref:Hypotheticial protein n=1 Tax=Schistosoma japonicum TaxID=6182 RepID=C1LQ64_SCHJA|nr:hypotheticial protein [Schistosoma japonicum]
MRTFGGIACLIPSLEMSYRLFTLVMWAALADPPYLMILRFPLVLTKLLVTRTKPFTAPV